MNRSTAEAPMSFALVPSVTSPRAPGLYPLERVGDHGADGLIVRSRPHLHMASDLPKYHWIATLPRVGPCGEDFEAPLAAARHGRLIGTPTIQRPRRLPAVTSPVLGKTCLPSDANHL